MKSKEEIAIENEAKFIFPVKLESIRSSNQYDINGDSRYGYIRGAKSESAKNYWYEQFKKEQGNTIKIRDHEPLPLKNGMSYQDKNGDIKVYNNGKWISKDLQEAIDSIKFPVRYNEDNELVVDSIGDAVAENYNGRNNAFGHYLADKINELNPNK